MSQHYAEVYSSSQVYTEIEEHIRIANSKFGPFASLHEALGVLQEELDEFIETVRMRQTDLRRQPMAAQEAIDIAAVAIRIAEQCSAGMLTR